MIAKIHSLWRFFTINRKFLQRSLEFKRRNICHRQFCSSFDNTDNSIMELKTVISKLNKFAPTTLAESWDNVGLLVEPSPPHLVKSFLLTNDLTEDVMDEAVNKKVDFILSYHPPIFVPLKTLTQRTWKERVIVKCIENRIALYSPHTSYDALAGGVNDWLLSAFGPGKTEPLHPVLSKAFPSCKGYHVQVTGEEAAITDLKSKLGAINGVELAAFNGSSAKGEAIYQLLLNCTEKALSATVACLQKYPDIYQNTEIIQLAKPPVPGHGMGRLCKLTSPIKLSESVSMAKRHLQLCHVRLAMGVGHDEDKIIKKVAVCAGSGGTVLKGTEADLYLTGEMSHHEVLDAVSRGISVILCDHSNTERGYFQILKGQLNELFENKISICISEVDTDPLKIV